MSWIFYSLIWWQSISFFVSNIFFYLQAWLPLQVQPLKLPNLHRYPIFILTHASVRMMSVLEQAQCVLHNIRDMCSLWILYKTLYWLLIHTTSLAVLPLCRCLSPRWSGWWLCTTLWGIQTVTCPFNKATASWSASTSTPTGAAAGSTAGRACSPELLLRAAQVWSSHGISGAVNISPSKHF